MSMNNVNEIIDYFVNLFNNESICDLFKNIDNVLILSDESNQYVSKYLAFVLNHKYNYISTSEVISNISDSKLKVYNNLVIIDSKTEEYLKSKKINAQIVNISHLIQNNITKFEVKGLALTWCIISLGLVIYYNDCALDRLKRINEKINNADIQSIKNYDVIVCNELMNIGLKVFNSNVKSIPLISFIDQNKHYDNVLFIGYFSEQDKETINTISDNSNMILCEFNDDIEQIVYGMLLGMYIGG